MARRPGAAVARRARRRQPARRARSACAPRRIRDETLHRPRRRARLPGRPHRVRRLGRRAVRRRGRGRRPTGQDPVIVRRLPMLATSRSVALGGARRGRPRRRRRRRRPVFATAPLPWMPSAPPAGDAHEHVVLPRRPGGGEEGTGGEVVIANAGDARSRSASRCSPAPARPVEQALTVPPYERSRRRRRRASVTTPYAGAMVEIDGGGGLVEQRADRTRPATSVAPCATSDVVDVVPRRGLHGREQQRAARADQPVRRVGDRRHRLRHRRRVAPAGRAAGLPGPAALGADHRPGLDRRPRRGRGRGERRGHAAATSSSGGPSSTTAAGGSATA